MTTELESTNTETTQRIYDTIDNDDFDGLREVISEDVLLRVPGQDDVHGVDGYVETVQSAKQGFPDATTEIQHMYAVDDVVVTHFTWRATHDGEFEGIEPTGQRVEAEGVCINRFEDGKAVEDLNFWDNLDLYEQLGVMEQSI